MNIRTLQFVALVALLVAGTPTYAQIAIPDQSGTPATPEIGTIAQGVVTDIDLVNRTLSLQDGEQFTLASSIAETSIPAIGEQVEVTYDVEGGQKVVHVIDAGDLGGGHR